MAELGALHGRAGRPSSRTIATKAKGGMSHTTANGVILGKRLAGWDVTRRVAVALGAEDVDHLRELWNAAMVETHSRSADPPDRAPAVAFIGHGEAAILAELTAIRQLLERIADGKATT